MSEIKEIERDGKKVFEYRFQPTLDDGMTPIGGEQVVYGTTHQELMDKAAENYQNLYRKNRELLLKDKLGVPPQPAPAIPIKFQPRSLTAEERIRLAKDLNDPEKVNDAIDLALEAKLGGKPEQITETIIENNQRAVAIRAAQEASAWREMHPEFHASATNCRALASWIENRHLEFSVANFDKAYEELSPALEKTPPSAPRTEPTPVQATPPAALPAGDGGAQPQPVIPTTVSRSTGTTHGTPPQEGMTIEKFRRLSTDERRKYMRDNPGFLNALA